MRLNSRLLCLAVLVAASPRLRAQAVERTDTPRHGALRVTFDPRIMTWERQYSAGGVQGIGAAFSGDSLSAGIPSVVRLQQDVRALTGLAGYVATLGHELLAVRAERRATPIQLEYGITDRLGLSVTVPIVRVEVREGYLAAPPGANIGSVPQATTDSARYLTFFNDLDAALTQLEGNILAGDYGCPGSAACAQANDLLTQGQAMRVALARAVYGTPDTAAAYLPLAESEAGKRLNAVVTDLGHTLADSFNIAAFSKDTFLLPSSPISGTAIAALYAERTDSLGLSPYGGTTLRRLRFFPGDVEVAGKYRFLVTRRYVGAARLLVRLPTGHQDSPNDPFDLATGDHQVDLEGAVTQELTLWGHLWLNLSIRAGRQFAGERERRIGPVDQPFLPSTTLARLRWDPGDYLAGDFAPMFRFTPQFAVGLTAGFFTQQRDRYAFLSPQDSSVVAGQVGAPVDAGVLDAGTGIRLARLGLAATYVGPHTEAGFSVERTVSGAGGPVPVATVFRIVLRQSLQLF
jgi:hypothetical protein